MKANVRIEVVGTGRSLYTPSTPEGAPRYVTEYHCNRRGLANLLRFERSQPAVSRVRVAWKAPGAFDKRTDRSLAV